MAIVEGTIVDGRFEVDRAAAVHGEHGDAAVDQIADHFRDQNVEVSTSSAMPVDGSGSRRDVAASLSERLAVPDGSRGAVDATAKAAADARPVISDRHPTDYIPATDTDQQRLQELRAESENPRHWIEAVNPGYAEQREMSRGDRPHLNRTMNCGDAARAVQDTYDGKPRAAAAAAGESHSQMKEWSGSPGELTSYESVETALSKPGDSAVLIVETETRGHAFNAINIDGRVHYVDGQTSEVSPWPPPFSDGPGTLTAWYFHR